MTDQSTCLTTLRRAAKSRRLRVVKIRENSPAHVQCGPYMLTALDTNGVLCAGLELSDLADEIALH